MKAILEENVLVLVPETTEELAELSAWKRERAGHVFHAFEEPGAGLSMRDLGAHEDACREPINVTSRSEDPAIRLISNFAPTPFELDGRRYGSVEAFWQGLKFTDERARTRIAALDGGAARRSGAGQGYGPTIVYEGRSIAVGTWEHWVLMERACQAKFSQCAGPREALLATKDRPLTHKLRRDSCTIPGVIMANIWMNLRGRLANAK